MHDRSIINNEGDAYINNINNIEDRDMMLFNEHEVICST